MAHFARIENNIVKEVLVVPDEQENRGQEYLANDLGLGGTWIQTSYNTKAGVNVAGGTPIRKNYAGIGYEYDPDWDAFRPPRPYPSWKLDYQTFQWVPPIPAPDTVEGFVWRWSEDNKEWIQIPQPIQQVIE
jgi:hypothetical protein